MVEIPLWVIVPVVSALLTGGVGIGFWGSKFVTHAVCRMRRDACDKIREKEQSEEKTNRRNAWKEVSETKILAQKTNTLTHNIVVALAGQGIEIKGA